MTDPSPSTQPVRALNMAIDAAQASIDRFNANIADIRAIKQDQETRLNVYDDQIADQQDLITAKQGEIAEYRAAITKLAAG